MLKTYLVYTLNTEIRHKNGTFRDVFYILAPDTQHHHDGLAKNWTLNVYALSLQK